MKGKGLVRAYGRGSGEKLYRGIPLVKDGRRRAFVPFESGHARYPQTGAYAVDGDALKNNHSQM